MRSSKPDVELESVVENTTIAYAKERGWWYCRKIKFIGRRAAPDRLFIKNGVHIWIEFKRPGKDLRPDQVREIARMRKVGATVYVIDNIEDGKAIFD